MTRGRLLIAGFAVFSAMMAMDAAAQDCAEWLKWVCPDKTPSNPATKEGTRPGQGKKLTRSKVGADSPADPKAQPAQVPDSARPAKATRPTLSSDQRLARQVERRGAPPGATMNDQDKALFQEFLVWFNEQRPNAATGR